MKIGKTAGNHQGTSLVEFALILPVFLMLILGIIDFGRYFFVQHTVQFATREGTRLGLVGKTISDPLGHSMSREASIVKTIQDNASAAVDPLKLKINIFPVKGDYSDPVGWETLLIPGDPGQYMRVRTRYTFEFLTPLIGSFFPGGVIGIKAEATYRNELFDA